MIQNVTDFKNFTIFNSLLNSDHPLMGKWLFRVTLTDGAENPATGFVRHFCVSDAEQEAIAAREEILSEALRRGWTVALCGDNHGPVQLRIATEIERLSPKKNP